MSHLTFSTLRALDTQSGTNLAYLCAVNMKPSKESRTKSRLAYIYEALFPSVTDACVMDECDGDFTARQLKH